VVPDVVPPVSADQQDPSVEEGQGWAARAGSEVAARNGFSASLTGARAVRLDLQRMRIRTLRRIDGDVTTAAPRRLELLGRWRGPKVLLDGAPVSVTRLAAGVIAVNLPAGKHSLVIN